LAVREGKRIAGMITLGEKNGRGDIGLIAVNPASRGKGYGEALVRSAHRWFIRQGFHEAQVVTQRRNSSACHLFEKCGFSVEKIEHYYHFWLR
jgi:dTDP-4-amino-4,6-dideoxy-D-galactose acyltransferase